MRTQDATLPPLGIRAGRYVGGVELTDVDALLVLSFGGPESMPEVLPFLRQVTAGRNIPDKRLLQVGEQYRVLGGVSPLNEHNRALTARLAAQAPATWPGQRVWLANRNSPPFPADTLAAMTAAGVRRAAVFVTSAFSSYSGCRQYRENLADGLAAAGTDLRLQVLPRFHDHPILRQIWADRVRQASPGPGDRVVFVTHSLPVGQASGVVPGVTGYLPQHQELARAVAAAADVTDWTLAFQSRSGPPQQPWLEPDIGDVVARAAGDGIQRVIVAPIGFLADNLEIRWDLDVTAAKTAAEHGIRFDRLEPPQGDDRFTDLVWDLFAGADGVPCAAGCCPNPRGPRPAVGEHR